MEPGRAFIPETRKADMILRHPIPVPPADEFDTFDVAPIFIPAPELNKFVAAAFLDESSPLYNEEHAHLTQAAIGFLWTSVANTRQMRRVLGEAEQPNLKGGKWQRARQEKQLIDWFGSVPDFVVTFDAGFWSEAASIEVLALLEHELYHCGQAVDEFGFPKFRQSDGSPVFAIRGHDVEEFAGVLRRYGADAAGRDVRDFVDAARVKPTIGTAKIRKLCGSCV